MEPNEQELNMLEEAGAYEVMANTKGWELTKNFITEKIQQFTNRAIIDGFKTMD
jgi:predicted ester cyclase